ncbi:MAG: aminoglycoside 3'-phosphotransferase [Actinobacteria bacterium]|nr:aminoglycoside 3'-phosphotransferase [Actinomycetota bacterium]
MSVPVARIPASDTSVPERVRELAGSAALVPVWENGIGGLTFHTDDGRFIKWGPRQLETTMRDEAERARWASAWTRVPMVRAQGEDGAHEWLVTTALPGLSAVDPHWIARPETAVRAVGAALRRLHDALPVAECPWSWGVDERIRNAAARGVIVPERLRDAPPIDRLVVCHGDACVPNTLLDDAGRGFAHVDLAALGTADRWADIAVASMSTTWNYGPGYEDLLIEAYGVDPDRDRLAYYRDLWDAT